MINLGWILIGLPLYMVLMDNSMFSGDIPLALRISGIIFGLIMVVFGLKNHRN